MPFHKISIEVDLIFNIYIYIYIYNIKNTEVICNKSNTLLWSLWKLTAKIVEDFFFFFEGIPLVQKLYFFNPSFIVA